MAVVTMMPGGAALGSVRLLPVVCGVEGRVVG